MSNLIEIEKPLCKLFFRKSIFAIGVLLSLATASPVWASSYHHALDNWVTSWSSPSMAQAPAREATPTDPGFVPRAFENQTIRQIAHISLGGQRVRIAYPTRLALNHCV